MENLGFSMNLEKSSEILRSSVRNPENVDTFDPGKKKEDQNGSPQILSPPGNGPVAIKSREFQLDITYALKKHNFMVGHPTKPLELVAIDMKTSNPNSPVSATTDASGTGWRIGCQGIRTNHGNGGCPRTFSTQ
ncbi:hypothetical protein AYI70_g8160 [Smittium culicis]|uniref:Uncharacterized protein n=1 Tax=Smittium culicis TaxID=133412 RepID=A0A1R1XH89_9FUNG|nr:hypothetical protein AYI70_g8160 [Smittium culicis]